MRELVVASAVAFVGDVALADPTLKEDGQGEETWSGA
jgi:exosome complex RNA-binding protein Rrp42 (RNase PH superfamily)